MTVVNLTQRLEERIGALLEDLVPDGEEVGFALEAGTLPWQGQQIPGYAVYLFIPDPVDVSRDLSGPGRFLFPLAVTDRVLAEGLRAMLEKLWDLRSRNLQAARSGLALGPESMN